jgi:xanthine dehydrogenase accessory factor
MPRDAEDMPNDIRENMIDAFDRIPEALHSNAGAMLATVIGTSGSTPASALSRMLVGETGERLAGTIGGGCVEGDVICAARDLAGSGTSAVMTFTLDEDHPESGMLCGGTVDVFIEPVSGRDLGFIESLRERRDSGEDSIKGTLVAPDGMILDRFLIPPDCTAILPAHLIESGVHGEESERFLRRFLPERAELEAAVEEMNRRGIAARIPVSEGRLILEPVAGTPSLCLFGGGHVSLAVSKIAALAGFRVTVIDDRPEFANPERFPEAARTVAADFLESFSRITLKPSSSIVIVTRGHKADELVLGVAVTTSAGYIGMIGSRKKVAAVFDRLVARGVPAEALRRVHTPIGLNIGAVTPGEIAVSIVSELIHTRRSPLAPLGFKSDRTAS